MRQKNNKMCKVFCCNCKYAKWDWALSYTKVICFCNHESNIIRKRKDLFYPELKQEFYIKNKSHNCPNYKRKWWKLFLTKSDYYYHQFDIPEEIENKPKINTSYGLTKEQIAIKKENDLKELLSIKGDFDARNTNA